MSKSVRGISILVMRMNGKNNHKKIKRRRIIALLTRGEMEYLDKLSMDSLFSTGHKLSRVSIISALLDTAMSLGIKAEGIRNKKELVQRILNALRGQKERREYPRLKRDLVVRFRKMDSMVQYKYSATGNIGLGGFKMDVAFFDEPFPIGQIVEATIKTPQEEEEPIRAIGRVAWVKEKGDGHSHEIGIALTYIKKEDRERYFKYLGKEKDSEKPLKSEGGK